MWNVVTPILAAVIAGVVSVLVTKATTTAATQATENQLLQTQFKEVIAKRLEVYPALWRVLIHYESNWDHDGKPKTREWAEEYVARLNEVNLDAGLFFSQDLYLKFVQLRRALYAAIEVTEPGEHVLDASAIRFAVYGRGGEPGLSTHLKDDLGSYRSGLLELRARPWASWGRSA